MARNEGDRRLRDHARYAIAGTMLTDGSHTVPDSALVELRIRRPCRETISG